MQATLKEIKTYRFPPLAARCVKDFEIPEEAINADAELSKRMDGCAGELVRLSLLGIAGYGFLLKEIAIGSASGLAACQKNATLFLSGAFCLAITVCLAFVARELLVRCSGIQIAILRTFGKLENSGWSESQIGILRASLDSYRTEQRRKLVLNTYCMRTAHGLLAAGAIITVTCFAVVLHDLKPEMKKETPAAFQQIGRAASANQTQGR